jgi:hypothetical protein
VSTIVQPAHLSVPERVGSYGAEAVDLAKLYGRDLDAEQVLAVDAFMSHDAEGNPAAFEAAVLEPRQNGKTGGIMLPIVLADLFLFEPDLIVWTAHRFDTSQETFRDVQQIIEGCSALSRRVRRISQGNGDEAIELTDGGRLEFKARASGGGRGLSGKKVVLDEAYKLSPGSVGSLLPTLATRRDAQVLYGSSACHADSHVLRDLVGRGRAGDDPSLAYVEWCAPGGWEAPPCKRGDRCTHYRNVPGCALDDIDAWHAANPTLGRRITVDRLRSYRRTMTPEEFGREFLGWHDIPDAGETSPITSEMWEAWADVDSRAVGKPVLAIDCSWMSRSAAIVAASQGNTDLPHIEVVDYGPGTDWVVRRAVELNRSAEPVDWVIDPTGPAGALLPALKDAGIEPREMTARQMGQACVDFAKGNFQHTGDPILSTALECSARRDVGDGLWTWTRRKSGDICPLVAATEAAWGLSTAPPPPVVPWFYAD